MYAHYTPLSLREQYRIAFQVIRAAWGLSPRTRYQLEEIDGLSLKAILTAYESYTATFEQEAGPVRPVWSALNFGGAKRLIAQSA
jgi:hypothetical protein